MNAVRAVTSSTSSHTQSLSPAAPAAPSASPVPAAAITLPALAQKALSLAPPQPNNIIWGS